MVGLGNTQQPSGRTAQGSHARIATINSNSNRIATQTSPETSEPAGGRSHVPSSSDTGPCTSRSLATLRAATRRCARPRPRPVATPPPPARRPPPPPPAAEASGRKAVASCSGGEAFVAIAAPAPARARAVGSAAAMRAMRWVMTSSRGGGKSRGRLKYLSSPVSAVAVRPARSLQVCVECPWLRARRCGQRTCCAAGLWAHVSARCHGGGAWFMCRWGKLVSFCGVSTAENRRALPKPFVLFFRRLEMTPLLVRVSLS